MKNVYKLLLTSIAVAVLLGGLAGCNTMKHEPAPAAPEPTLEPNPIAVDSASLPGFDRFRFRGALAQCQRDTLN